MPPSKAIESCRALGAMRLSLMITIVFETS